MAKKLSRSQIDGFGKPKDMIDGLLNAQVTRVEEALGGRFRGIGNKILSLFVKDGNRLQLSAEFISEKIGKRISEDEICQILDKLTEGGLLQFAGENTYEIANNVLAQRAYQKVEGVNLLLRQMEMMVRNRIERNVLLDEDDLKYLESSLDLLELTPDERAFVDKSYEAIRKRKRRLVYLITLAFILLSTLTTWALFNERRTIKLNDDLELTLEQLRKDSVTLYNTAVELRNAERMLLLQNDSLDNERVKAEQLRSEAEIAQRLEATARLKADIAANEAKIERGKAESEANRATAAALLAEQKQAEAEELKKQADVARERAVEARTRAEAFNEIVISRNVATRALQIENAQLKALVALQTYTINKAYPKFGDPTHPYIIKALYNAALDFNKNLEISISNIHNGSVKDIVFHPTKDIFYTTGSDGNVYEWNVVNWARVGVPTVTVNSLPGVDGGAVHNNLFLDRNGDYLLISGELPIVQRFNTRARQLDAIFPIAANAEIYQSGFIEDKDHIIAFGLDTAYLVSSNGDLKLIKKQRSGSNLVAYHNGNYLPLSFQGTVNAQIPGRPTYELSIQSFRNNVLKQDNLEVTGDNFGALTATGQYQVNNDTTFVAFGFENGKILFFKIDLNRFSPLSGHIVYEQHLAAISDIAFSHNGSFLGVASFDGTVTVWDLRRYADPTYLPMTFDIHDGWATAIEFSRDDRFLLVGDRGGSITFWNLNPDDYAERICQDILEYSRDPAQRQISKENWQRFFGSELQQRDICK